jgi:hypothetical protein
MGFVRRGVDDGGTITLTCAQATCQQAWFVIRHVRLIPAPPIEDSPSALMRFDVQNQGSRQIMDIDVRLILLATASENQEVASPQVLAGPAGGGRPGCTTARAAPPRSPWSVGFSDTRRSGRVMKTYGAAVRALGAIGAVISSRSAESERRCPDGRLRAVRRADVQAAPGKRVNRTPTIDPGPVSISTELAGATRRRRHNVTKRCHRCETPVMMARC